MVELVIDDGVVLHVQEHGDPAGRRVVLTHGYASSSEESWIASGFVEHLTGAGLHVVTWDMRGHGRSSRPVTAEYYGDALLATDLVEVVGSSADETVVVGYSMGAAVTLLALAVGLRPAAAVVGAAPPAVLRWSDDDEAQRRAAVEALRADRVNDEWLRDWIDSLEASGASRLALAALLEAHRPVIEDFSIITTPTVVAAGAVDVMAAKPAELASRMPNARSVELPGDHVTAMLCDEFLALVLEVASR